MTQFEKITQSPETLGAFLAALPVMDGPWDTEFHAQYCADCLYLGCDDCPHEEFRNNPGWWLTLEAGPAEEPGTVVIDLEPAEAERELTPEERAEMERLRPMFRYFMGKDNKTGTIEIGPMNGENLIILSGPEEARWFMENLKELIQESTIRG